IVPGITSAISVPAYNGIPVTHRDFCSSVHIITGHKRAGASYDIDFEALVRTRGTLVFLMGLASLPDIAEGLIRGGMRPDMPAAVLSRGTTARQRRVVAQLSELAEQTRRAQIEAPAIIVVGEVCSLADAFNWLEKKPLFGRKILVTRPAQLISAMADKLRSQGAEVLELPAIRTVPMDGTALTDALASIPEKGSFDWIVFTSPTGVRIFMEKLSEEGDLRLISSSRIAAIGSGTAKELKKYALKADFVPSVYDGDTLGRELAGKLAPGMRVLIPRAAIGNRELTDHLTKADGVEILDVPTYDTLYEQSELIDEAEEFRRGKIDFAVFTSASTVRGFARAVGDLDYSLVNAVCIGKQTRAAADELGMHTFVSEKATMDSVVEKVIELCTQDS
ncbi:MAG: uroporphyrinogen-III synthase, partial [Oscillospiraceae bacterium]|nr:uroporphyrinogen-III synthase [Oscillospiraceae bacterium]